MKIVICELYQLSRVGGEYILDPEKGVLKRKRIALRKSTVKKYNETPKLSGRLYVVLEGETEKYHKERKAQLDKVAADKKAKEMKNTNIVMSEVGAGIADAITKANIGGGDDGAVAKLKEDLAKEKEKTKAAKEKTKEVEEKAAKDIENAKKENKGGLPK